MTVETHFLLDEAEIQGTWSHTSPGGVRVTLVTFNKDSTITDMTYRERLIFKAPNVSLTIKRLRVEDEGDYHLNLNMEFHNKTGLAKEERTVHVTVDGERPSPLRQPVPCYGPSTDQRSSFVSHSPRVRSGPCEEPSARRGGGPGQRNLVLRC